MAWALALAPFKDNFWTTSHQPGSSVGDATEPNPHLQAAVATLSAGVVTPGDGINYSNQPLIMRSCRTDGLILKPSRSAVTLDSTFLKQSFGSTGPAGELWTTYNMIGRVGRWDHIFAAGLSTSYQLSAGELTLDMAGARTISNSIAYSINTLSFDVSTLIMKPFDNSQALNVPACGYSDFQLWHVAPVFTSGYSLLGELSKWVPVSEGRIVEIQESESSLSVFAKGVWQEQVTLYFTQGNATNPLLIPMSCTVGSAGTVTFNVPAKTCTY